MDASRPTHSGDVDELVEAVASALVATSPAGLAELTGGQPYAASPTSRHDGFGDAYQAGRRAGVLEVARRVLEHGQDAGSQRAAAAARQRTGSGADAPERFTLAGSVLAAVAARPASTSGELARACLASVPQVSRATRQLLDAGLVASRRVGRHKQWTITPAGEELERTWRRL